MKTSKIFGILSFLILITTLFLIFKNENKELKKAYNTSTGKMETYDPETYGGAGGIIHEMSEESMQLRKSKERKKILLIGGGILTISLLLYSSNKTSEIKNDPIKNLEYLKNKNIISKTEFEEKRKQAEKIESEKKIAEAKNKELQKVISELANLKRQGILTEKEYQDKIKQIKDKTA